MNSGTLEDLDKKAKDILVNVLVENFKLWHKHWDARQLEMLTHSLRGLDIEALKLLASQLPNSQGHL